MNEPVRAGANAEEAAGLKKNREHVCKIICIILPVRLPESITSSVTASAIPETSFRLSVRLSPESRQRYVPLPESFTFALMSAEAFFFGSAIRAIFP